MLNGEGLMHCPFCHVSQVCFDESEGVPGWWQIRCGACGSSSGIAKDKIDLLKSWNIRPHEISTDVCLNCDCKKCKYERGEL
jgi:hypothetical protein